MVSITQQLSDKSLILKMPQELRHRMLVIYMQLMKHHVRQSEKLNWVFLLGKGWLGRQAFRFFMELVTIKTIKHADSFITAAKPSSILAHQFNTDIHGNFTSPFSFVKSLYLAFNVADIDLSTARPFMAEFGKSLSLFGGLEAFSFDISEYDFNKTFRHITGLGTYPASLKNVRIISSSTKVVEPCHASFCNLGVHPISQPHGEYVTLPWSLGGGSSFGSSLSSFNKAVKLDIYLSEDFDLDNDLQPVSPLLVGLTKSPFNCISIQLGVPLLDVSPDLVEVLLGYQSAKVVLSRHETRWEIRVLN